MRLKVQSVYLVVHCRVAARLVYDDNVRGLLVQVG